MYRLWCGDRLTSELTLKFPAHEDYIGFGELEIHVRAKSELPVENGFEIVVPMRLVIQGTRMYAEKNATYVRYAEGINL